MPSPFFNQKSMKRISSALFFQILSSKLLLLVVFGGIFLYPYLFTGFYLDDSFNVSTRYSLQSQELALWKEIIRNALHWITYDGRLYPLASLSTAIYYYAPDPLTYHTLILFFVCLSLVSFYAWLRSLEVNTSVSFFLVAIALSLFQIRAYHDPITSYACLLPVSASLGFSSSFFFKEYLKKGQVWKLFFSQFLFLSALLTYEVNLVFFFLLLATLKQTRRWKIALFPLSITIAYLATTLYLRTLHPPHYPGTTFSFSIRGIKTYLFQISAALPLIYPIFGRVSFLKGWTVLYQIFSLRTVIINLIYTYIFYQLLNQAIKKKELQLPDPVKWSAWSLILFPPVMIAITQKYQDEITRPGLGYLPVYLSYFGSALIISFLIIKNTPQKKVILTSSILGSLATLTFTINLMATSALNHIWKDPREMLEDAFQKKILEPHLIKKDFINVTDHYWLNPQYLLQQSQIKIPISDWTLFLEKSPQGKTVFNFDTFSSDLGWIVMAPIHSFQNQKYSSHGPIQIWLYSRGISFNQMKSLNLRLSTQFIIPIASLNWKPMNLNWSYSEVNTEINDLFAWRSQPLIESLNLTKKMRRKSFTPNNP